MAAKTIVVFGATCKSGVELCRLSAEGGWHTIAVVRPASDRSKLKGIDVEIREADLFDEDSVAEAFDGVATGAAVVSLVGGGFRDGKPVDAVGNIHIVDAALAARVGKFVFVTSLGCGDSWEASPDAQRKFLGEVLKLKTQAEDYLKGSGLNWVIIRPGGLIIPEPTGQAMLVEDQMTRGMINRTELGQLAFRAVANDRLAGKAYAAVDRTQCENIKGREVVAVTL